MDDDKIFDEEGERPRIKVTDRRKFTADGTPVGRSATDEAETDSAPRPVDGATDGAGAEPATADTKAGDATDRTDQAAAAADAPADKGEEAVADEPAADQTAADQPAADQQEAGGPATDEAPAAAAGDDGEPRIAGPAPSMADLPRDFSAFVESLYYEAMLFMGAIPDPRTGQVHEDVELAKYKIDILGMLQEKTEGNRTPEETQHLEEILYQLRMVYLQKSKAIKL